MVSTPACRYHPIGKGVLHEPATQAVGAARRGFYRWSHEQARLLRSGRVDAADLATIAEELETSGRSEAAALRSSLRLIILHLLKLTVQPERASRSWRSTIVRERNKAERTLQENPSLKAKLPTLFAEAYEDGRREAIAETGFDAASFPEEPGMTVEQVRDHANWPQAYHTGE